MCISSLQHDFDIAARTPCHCHFIPTVSKRNPIPNRSLKVPLDSFDVTCYATGSLPSTLNPRPYKPHTLNLNSGRLPWSGQERTPARRVTEAGRANGPQPRVTNHLVLHEMEAIIRYKVYGGIKECIISGSGYTQTWAQHHSNDPASQAHSTTF